MRRKLVLLALAVGGLLAPAAAHAAGDPIMPLGDVRAGMQCTGYSVFSGQRIDPFGVEVIDVVGPAESGGTDPRILFRVHGENIERTGIARGFSGSPIYCPGADGVARVAGAASEGVGDYGDLTALATPIEAVIGTPLAPTLGAQPKRWARAAREHRALLATARPLATPFVVGGVTGPVLRALRTRAAKRGITLLQAAPPAAPATFGGFRPGSAVGTGFTSGELSLGAVGTISYVDGPDVWAYGHPLEGAGRRSLFLQDAAIATTIVNPTAPLTDGSSYKFGGPVADVGTLTSDGNSGVAGTVGALPPAIPVHVEATDTDTGTTLDTDFEAADETAIDNPSGVSGLAFGAPTAVLQIPTQVFGAAPKRTAGELCFQIRARERKAPMRFCNRYVADDLTGVSDSQTFTTLVGANAASDVSSALTAVDAFNGPELHITGVQAKLTLTRGERMAYLRGVRLPRTVRRGSTVRGTFVAQVVRGARLRIPFSLRIPRGVRPGVRTIGFSGPAPDSSDADMLDSIIIDLDGGGGGNTDQSGPRTVAALARKIGHIERYDGVRTRLAGQRIRVLRDDRYRLGGKARATVRVRR